MNMNIKSVETILTCPGRNYLIVKITTESGLVGYGDATLNGREKVVQTLIDEYFAKILVGMDASRIADIWQFLFKGAYWRGGPVQMTAIAGIDMALWDIKGKALDVPVYQLLGGKARNYITTYIHVHGHTYEELRDEMRRKMENGYRILRYSFDTQDAADPELWYVQPHQDIAKGRIEVKTTDGAQPWDSEQYAEDLIRITDNIRRDFGSSVALIHDTHDRLSLAQAAVVGKELERSRLMFWEDPVDPFCRDHVKRLREVCSTPLGIGELFNTIGDYHQLVSENLIDFVRADISHYGGITGCVELARFAEPFHIQTAFHGPSDISPLAHGALLNIDLNVPNFGVQETTIFSGKALEVFNHHARYERGKAFSEDAPGLGVDVNEEAAREYPYVPASLPHLRDNMGAMFDW